MGSNNQDRLTGGLLGAALALGLCAVIWLVWLRPGSNPFGPKASEVEYEYGRPLKDGEVTYAKYQKYHLDESNVPNADRADVAKGMDTWYWWTGGNQAFWRELSQQTGILPIKADLLALLHSTPRASRFESLGTMNDPDCVAAEKPDRYGLLIDRMKDGTQKEYDVADYGWASGVIGLRLFKNPKFDSAKWSLPKYLADPKLVEPPYLVGMACAVCHVSFNPLHPPADPNEPTWHNLASMIGNQYLREGRLVAGINRLAPDQFAWHYIETQQHGTSETSRLDTDFINNPNAVNSVYRLSERLKLAPPEEITPTQKKILQKLYADMSVPTDTDLGGSDEKPTLKVPHILKDGSDSMSVPVASLRVWVNIGSMHEQWMKSWAISLNHLKDNIRDGFKQKPFEILEAQKDPDSWWNKTEKRMPGLEKFAKTFDGYPLEQATETEIDGKPRGKSGKEYLDNDTDKLRKGKLAFAHKCARCHSSKMPEPMPQDPKDQEKAWEAVVLKDDFLKGNYLSDDKRYPISELHTNAARAMGTNPMRGNIWDNFSSETYKNQKDANGVQLQDSDDKGKPIDLYNPLTGKRDIKYTVPNKFAPSYRTPTLVSVWATGPYLHNNSLGLYNGDPSIAGRMAAFEDGMRKLLSPELRLKERSIKLTTEDSHLPDFFDLIRREIPELAAFDLQPKLLIIPKGTPINLVMNLHARDVKEVVKAYIVAVLQGRPKIDLPLLQGRNHELGLEAMARKLLELNQCPDFIEDKGHTYGSDLSPDDKEALIEFLKRF
ncbi:MAG TPA: hypothetical protein VH592_04835 [Gemmataceae bacterium]